MLSQIKQLQVTFSCLIYGTILYQLYVCSALQYVIYCSRISIVIYQVLYYIWQFTKGSVNTVVLIVHYIINHTGIGNIKLQQIRVLYCSSRYTKFTVAGTILQYSSTGSFLQQTLYCSSRGSVLLFYRVCRHSQQTRLISCICSIINASVVSHLLYPEPIVTFNAGCRQPGRLSTDNNTLYQFAA